MGQGKAGRRRAGVGFRWRLARAVARVAATEVRATRAQRVIEGELGDDWEQTLAWAVEEAEVLKAARRTEAAAAQQRGAEEREGWEGEWQGERAEEAGAR